MGELAGQGRGQYFSRYCEQAVWEDKGNFYMKEIRVSSCRGYLFPQKGPCGYKKVKEKSKVDFSDVLEQEKKRLERSQNAYSGTDKREDLCKSGRI